jgi:hypothetical protein
MDGFATAWDLNRQFIYQYYALPPAQKLTEINIADIVAQDIVNIAGLFCSDKASRGLSP